MVRAWEAGRLWVGPPEWVERYCGGGHPGMRAVQGVREDARLEEEVCI